MTYLTRVALARTLALGTGAMASDATYVDCEADIADNLTSALGCEVRTDETQDLLHTDQITVNKGDGLFDIDT